MDGHERHSEPCILMFVVFSIWFRIVVVSSLLGMGSGLGGHQHCEVRYVRVAVLSPDGVKQ